MKNLSTLLAAMLLAATASAQSPVLQFCQEDGTVIPSGEEIRVTMPNPTFLEYGIYQFDSGIYIKNNADVSVSASLTVDVQSISGDLGVCLGIVCRNYQERGKYEVKDVMLSAGSFSDLQYHWSPAMDENHEPMDGSCNALLTLSANGEPCADIRVIFVRGDKESDPVGVIEFENDPVMEGTRLWGYACGEDVKIVPFGDQNMSDGRYEACIFVPGNAALHGAKICGIWMPIYNDKLTDIAVWTTTELGGEKTIVKAVDRNIHPGYVTIPFEQELDIPVTGFYLGYSFDLKIHKRDDIACIGAAAADSPMLNGLFWGPEGHPIFSSQMWVSAMQLFVKDMKTIDNAATILAVSADASAIGRKSSLSATICNDGQGIESLGYTLTIDGTETTGEYVFDNPVKEGHNQNAKFTIGYDAPGTIGTFQASLAINTVNGQPNEAVVTPYTFEVSTVTRIVDRLTVIEELTGTGCPNCPRGWVGMETVRNRKSDKAVGIAWHNYNTSDPMFLSNYASLGLAGAPQCTIDRRIVCDPYWGDYEADKNILTLVDEFNEQIPTVAVEVKGAFTDDTYQQINVSSTTEFLTNVKGYQIAFAITADDLTETGSEWMQMSNYYDLPLSEADEYIDPEMPEILKFCEGEEWGTKFVSLTYNDVLIASTYNDLCETLVPAFTKGKIAELETSEYTIDMPTQAALVGALDYEKIYVTAIVTDENGKIANAARARVISAKEAAGIVDIQSNATPSRGYNLMGLAVNPAAARGICIRDGRKIVRNSNHR